MSRKTNPFAGLYLINLSKRFACAIAVIFIYAQANAQNAPGVPERAALQKSLFSKYATEDAATKHYAYSAATVCTFPGPGYRCKAHGKIVCCECEQAYNNEIDKTIEAAQKKSDDYNAAKQAEEVKKQTAAQNKQQEQQNNNTGNNYNNRNTSSLYNGTVTPNTAANTRQQNYRQQVNNYLSAANNESNPIQQSLYLNLARINATAAGNKTQAAQIQQIQNQQTAQQVGNLVQQAGNLWLAIHAKRDAEREARYQANMQREEAERNLNKEFNENKKPYLDALSQLTLQDKTRLRKAGTRFEQLMYINNVAARNIKVQEINDAAVHVSYDNSITYDSINLNNTADNMLDITQQQMNKTTAAALLDFRYSKYLENVKKKNGYPISDAILIDIANAEALLHGVYNIKKHRYETEKDTGKAIAYLKKAALLVIPEADKTKKYYLTFDKHQSFDQALKYYESFTFTHKDDYYFDGGYIGLQQMLASAELANIYFDSAAKYQQPDYYKEAWEQYSKSVSYFLDNLHDYYVACVSGKDFAGKYTSKYTASRYNHVFTSVYTNLITLTYQLMLQSGMDEAYIDSCTDFVTQAYIRYYDPNYHASYAAIASKYEYGSRQDKDLYKSLETYRKAQSAGEDVVNDIKRVQIKIAAQQRKDSLSRVIPGGKGAASSSHTLSAARFSGGATAFKSYIANNFILFLPGVNNDLLKGKILVEFIIEKNGTCTVDKITYTDNNLQPYEDHIKEFFETMPLWKPAMQNGHAVPYRLKQTINF